MPQSSYFNGDIRGHNVIVGSHFETGATMNNYFGAYPGMQDGPSRKQLPFSTVPFSPDTDFVDRPELISWIHDTCTGPGARAALVGLGGIGKSQLAIRYAYNIRDASPQTFVFWVQASTKARFEEAYRDIADRLDLPRRNNPQVDVLRLVSNWLCDETNGKWVMIVDNADDIEVFYSGEMGTIHKSLAPVSTSLAAYLPQSPNGSILITSRSKDAAARLAGGHKNIKEVRAMDESQALHLFQSKMQDPLNEEGAADLVHALDKIPLAITQAAAHINRRGRITPSDYLDEFQRNDKKRRSLLHWDAGDLRRDPQASNSVVLTWQMSFERIDKQRHSAADLLSLMSFFNPQGIPEWILRTYSRSISQTSNDETDSAFDEDLDTLLAYSLVRATMDKGVWEMHALVQFCMRVWLSSFGDTEKWSYSFLALMASEFPDPEFENWAKCQQLLPHVELLYKSEPSNDQSMREWAKVLDNAARYIRTAQGKYDDAEKLNRRVLEEAEKELDAQHPLILMSVGNLASVLESQGKYDEAEELNRRALKGWEMSLGVQHPDTLGSASNLAYVLRFKGKYDEAETLSRRAVQGKELELGVNHPHTLVCVSILAGVLRDQMKYDEAEKLSRRVLEGREKELGAWHPDTLTGVSNLAVVLGHQGKYEEAEKLSRQALEGKEKMLGVRHPSTLTNMNNLAGILRDQGRYAEAETLSRRVLEETEKGLGGQHPDTMTCVYNLAYLLHKQKQYIEASELYERACNGYKQKLGPQHPTSILCLGDFTAMQQEAEQTGPRPRGKSNNTHRESPENQPPCSITTLSSDATPRPGSSNQRSQQGSFYRRIRSMIRRTNS